MNPEKKESEKKYQLLFELAQDFNLILSMNGKILEVNETCYKALGYTKEELIGKQISEIVSSDYKSEVPARIALVKRRGSAVFESGYVRKDGSVIPVEVSVRMVNIDGETCQYGIARDITERLEMEKTLRKNEEKYRAVIETLGDGFWITDLKGNFIEVNDVYLKQSGYSREELLSMRIPDVEAKEKPEETKEHIEKLIKDGHDRFETLHRKKNGEIWPVEIVTNFWKIGEGMLFVFVIDITSRKKAEEEIRLMASVFQNSREAMLISDNQNRIQKVNLAFCELTGYSTEEVIGKDPKIVSAGKQTPEFYRDMWKNVVNEGKWQGEIWDRRKDGTEYPKWLSISTIKNEQGDIINYIGNFSDITERKRAEAEILELAYHDTLTGLHNRHSLISHLDQEIVRAKRTGKKIAVMFIDLDRFKAINDTLGHHVGDSLLIEVASRMRKSIRESDIVSRFGGDEFMILIPDVSDIEGVKIIAREIIKNISLPFDFNETRVYTSPSIGICLFPEDGKSAAEIMQKADMAMYFAKSEGGSGYRFFTSEMSKITTERMIIENSIRNALDEDQFRLYFQPLIDIHGRIRGAEALIRWEHPELGVLSPDKFIPIAEESSLILKIGKWVISEACIVLNDWNNQGFLDIVMSVNVSASEFLQDNFISDIIKLIDAAGLHPQMIELEITESTAMKSPEKILKIMKEIKSHGIRLSIDDFGTGYSSLAYLSRFPIDQLKIDHSFVRDIENDSSILAITLATISLAKQLGKQVVVEGVENQRQADILFQNNCDLQQGYFYSRPVPEKEFLKILHQRNGKSV